MIKKIFLILFFAFIFTFPASAENYDIGDIYKEQYENSNFDSLYDLIDDETKRIIKEFEFYPDSIDNMGEFSIEKVFNILIYFFKDGIKAPLAVFLSILGTSILIGVVKAAEPDNKCFGISDIAGLSVVAIAIIAPAFMFFKTVSFTIKSAAVFMSGFIPIFAGILMSSGRPTTSTLTSASLLLSAEVCEQFSSFIVLPIVSVYLAITIASSFSDKIKIEKISATIQKTVSFCMTTVMTVFSAILSIQSVIGSSADSLSLRAFRLVAGSTPIIGSVVSEATGVVSSCLNTLKNSAVIYAVICFAVLFLPIIIQLLLWRLSMFCGGVVADMFGSHKISCLVTSVGYSFSVVTSVAVNTLIMFVISLTVIMMTSGGAI